MSIATSSPDHEKEIDNVQPSNIPDTSKQNSGTLEFHDPRDLSPMSLKYTDAGNYRRKRSQKELDELREDIIKKGGIIQSIVVRQTVENGLEIIAGFGRWQCALELWDSYGFKVPCLNMGYTITDSESVEIAIAENLKRSNVTIGDLSNAAKRYLSLTNNGDHATAAMKLGMSEKTYREYLQISNCEPELIDALDDDEKPILKGHCLILSQFPAEIQLNTLKNILADPKTYTVKYLKGKAKNFEFKLSNARFDIEKQGCNDCQYNSKQQFSIFSDCEEGDTCSNAVCYLNNQKTWLNETKIPDLKVEYGTVLKTEEKSISDVRPVDESNLGSNQVKKCANCQNCAVIVVSNIGDNFGKYRSNCCIDLECYSKHQHAFKESQIETSTNTEKNEKVSTAVSKPISTPEQENLTHSSTHSLNNTNSDSCQEAPAPKLSKKTERVYANMIQKIAAGFVSSHLSEQFTLATMVKSLSTNLRSKHYVSEDISKLCLMDPALLKAKLQDLLASFIAQEINLDTDSKDIHSFDSNRILRTIMIESLKQEDIREQAIASWTPTPDIWKLHTKHQITIICEDSGFKDAYEKEKGASTWSKMMKNSLSDIYKALDEFEFDWSDYAPDAYIEMAVKYKACP